MAIYHFTAKVMSRGNGDNAVQAAAYRSGEKLHADGLDRNFSFRKPEVAHREIFAPAHAPAWVYDRAKLWNAVEEKEINADGSVRIKARLAREFEFSLPNELTLDQNKALVSEFVNAELVARGMIADANFHMKPMNGHAHVMATVRHITPDGFGQSNRDWNKKEMILELRKAWAGHANRHLEAAGFDVRIDHRSLVDQGIDEEATVHLGRGETAADRRELNAEIMETREAAKELNRIKAEADAIHAQIRELESTPIPLPAELPGPVAQVQPNKAEPTSQKARLPDMGRVGPADLRHLFKSLADYRKALTDLGYGDGFAHAGFVQAVYGDMTARHVPQDDEEFKARCVFWKNTGRRYTKAQYRQDIQRTNASVWWLDEVLTLSETAPSGEFLRHAPKGFAGMAMKYIAEQADLGKWHYRERTPEVTAPTPPPKPPLGRPTAAPVWDELENRFGNKHPRLSGPLLENPYIVLEPNTRFEETRMGLRATWKSDHALVSADRVKAWSGLHYEKTFDEWRRLQGLVVAARLDLHETELAEKDAKVRAAQILLGRIQTAQEASNAGLGNRLAGKASELKSKLTKGTSRDDDLAQKRKKAEAYLGQCRDEWTTRLHELGATPTWLQDRMLHPATVSWSELAPHAKAPAQSFYLQSALRKTDAAMIQEYTDRAKSLKTSLDLARGLTTAPGRAVVVEGKTYMPKSTATIRALVQENLTEQVRHRLPEWSLPDDFTLAYQPEPEVVLAQTTRTNRDDWERPEPRQARRIRDGKVLAEEAGHYLVQGHDPDREDDKRPKLFLVLRKHLDQAMVTAKGWLNHITYSQAKDLAKVEHVDPVGNGGHAIRPQELAHNQDRGR